MLGHWPQIVSYIRSTGQQQEYQLVHGRVSSWSLILWYDIQNFPFYSVFAWFVVGTSVWCSSCRRWSFWVTAGADQGYSAGLLGVFQAMLCLEKGPRFLFVWAYVLFLQKFASSHRYTREFARRKWLGCVAWVWLYWCAVVVRFTIYGENEFPIKAMRAAKRRINVEKEKK